MGHCEVFAVCMLLLDQMKIFDEVDVFDAVRKLRKTNPSLMENVVSICVIVSFFG